MKAIIVTEPGGVDNLKFHETDKPVPTPNEVLIEVAAISINPVDVKTRKGGSLFDKMKTDIGVILGWDISGRIIAVGDNVTKFAPGDEVFGMVNFPGHGKAYAEYVAAPEDHLAKKPATLSHQEAAAATLALLTAWQVLVKEANLQRGQRVLIHAAAGGVGHFAIQVAKYLGAYVIGTASAANGDFIKSLGADEHIDYTRQNFEEAVQGVDVILDPIGGEVTQRSLEILNPGGVLISIVGGVKDYLQSIITEKGVRASNYLVHSSGEDMEQLALLLEKGIIRSFVSHQFTFDQLTAAHEQVESSHTRGKVVVTMP
ncbi:MAG TPA: NADP-dependent oxidoreductase [Flavisolibacter sp.]|nr:NADP-dependent oxidoreductase [Flavisolibacter sp.]